MDERVEEKVNIEIWVVRDETGRSGMRGRDKGGQTLMTL